MPSLGDLSYRLRHFPPSMSSRYCSCSSILLPLVVAVHLASNANLSSIYQCFSGLALFNFWHISGVSGYFSSFKIVRESGITRQTFALSSIAVRIGSNGSNDWTRMLCVLEHNVYEQFRAYILEFGV